MLKLYYEFLLSNAICVFDHCLPSSLAKVSKLKHGQALFGLWVSIVFIPKGCFMLCTKASKHGYLSNMYEWISYYRFIKIVEKNFNLNIQK